MVDIAVVQAMETLVNGNGLSSLDCINIHIRLPEVAVLVDLLEGLLLLGHQGTVHLPQLISRPTEVKLVSFRWHKVLVERAAHIPTARGIRIRLTPMIARWFCKRC